MQVLQMQAQLKVHHHVQGTWIGWDGMVPGGVKYRAAYAAQNARKVESSRVQK